MDVTVNPGAKSQPSTLHLEDGQNAQADIAGGAGSASPSVQPYGDLVALNTERLIVDAVGRDVLAEVSADYLGLLETSSAIYERNGDYALGIFSSGWCRFLDARSRELCRTDDNRKALTCGKWHCHDSCWAISKQAIDTGEPVDQACLGGIRLYAVPIKAEGTVIGAINFGYGTPPKDAVTLCELAERYQVTPEELRQQAEAYAPRPAEVIEVAKRRLGTTARLLGEIVHRMITEKELRESEQRLEIALRGADLGFWHWNVATGTVSFNDRWAAMLGYRLDEVEPHLRAWEERLHPEERDEVLGKVQAHLDGDMPHYECEHRLRHKDGHWIWVLDRGRVVDRDSRGRPLVATGTHLDITERKKAEQVLRESEQSFRAIADCMPQIVWSTRPDGYHDYYNRRWFEFTGADPADTEGEGWNPQFHPDDQERAWTVWRHSLESGDPYEIEYRLRAADGSYRWTLGRALPMRDASGRIVRWFGTCTDIQEIVEARELQARASVRLEELVAQRTRQLEDANRQLVHEMEERRQAEEALRHAQKMEAVGKLTGGVAHDFNNLLQVIAGNLQLLAKDIEGNGQAERRLGNALKGVERGAKLASQLLAFARRQPLEPKVVNLGRLMQGMGDMVRRAIGEEIEVETVIGGGLWNTFVDPAQVENAILNLAVNARDAMRGAGKLTIEAGNAKLDEDYARAHAEVKAGQYVMLAVTDTGCGMTADLVERVFEPFFTTKPEGQGTGLGLSMVYGFVKQSGGHVKIYSEVGHGTTIRIYLPRARQQEAAETEEPTGPVTGGTETVLVVEDDEQVRATVVEMLTDLGYRVLKASDGQSGLAIVNSGMPVDLLFTDVVMPGPVRSTELAKRAQEVLPNVAVVFTSGYTENAIVHGGRLDEGVNLLSKPYTREALARKVRHALGNAKQRGVPLPSAERPLPEQTVASQARQLRVLLVEDDDLIRMTTAAMLEGMGHTVVEAADAEEAIMALERQEVDVLVTDVTLPRMSGTELAVRVLPTRPSLRVVFATGHDLSLDGSLAGSTVLMKPYSEDDLRRALG